LCMTMKCVNMDKKIIFFIAILSFLLINNICSAEPRVIQKEELKKGKTEMTLAMLELEPGTVAAVIEIAKKSDTRIQSVYIENASIGKIKPGTEQGLYWYDLEKYLDGIVPGSGALVAKIDREREWRNTAHMNMAGARMDSRGTAADAWATVYVFGVGKIGESEFIIKYDEEGKRGKLKAKINIE